MVPVSTVMAPLKQESWYPGFPTPGSRFSRAGYGEALPSPPNLSRGESRFRIFSERPGCNPPRGRRVALAPDSLSRARFPRPRKALAPSPTPAAPYEAERGARAALPLRIPGTPGGGGSWLIGSRRARRRLLLPLPLLLLHLPLEQFEEAAVVGEQVHAARHLARHFLVPALGRCPRPRLGPSAPAAAGRRGARRLPAWRLRPSPSGSHFVTRCCAKDSGKAAPARAWRPTSQVPGNACREERSGPKSVSSGGGT